MGIPSLFYFLSKKYTNIFDKTKPHIDNLYFDLNSLIHPECYKILEQNTKWNDINKLEMEMIKEIKTAINLLIEYINPTKLVYLSIDGVAPLAKIKQQRDRRYKSIKTKEYIYNKKKEFAIDTETIWDSNCITPGTEFMSKLNKELNYFIENEIKFDGKIIFSSSDEPGEGEHKILQYLRRKSKNNSEYECIYGLDADLIMLSMISGRNNIYLFRENYENSYDIVNIKILKDCLEKDILEHLTNADNISSQNLINDFVFYCFLLGNDFIPTIPSLRIKDGSIIRLISIYCSIYDNLNEYLVLKNKINENFLLLLFENLSMIEEYTLQTYTNYDNNLNKNNNNNFKNEYEKHIFEYEKNIIYEKEDLNIGYDDYKYKYYNKYFYLDYNLDNMDNLYKSYINTLQWIYKYYFYQCSNWLFYYPYYVTPFASDIYKFLSNNKKEINVSIAKKNKPIKSIEQLLLVLPPQSNLILPFKYRKLQKSESLIYDLYPKSFSEIIIGNQNWKNIPILPNLDYNRIKQSII